MGDLSYIAALDIGTTTVRCHIVNSLAQTEGSADTKVKLIYPEVGHAEIDPDDLWQTVVNIIKQAISNAKLEPKDIKCLAISTQRGTFTNWKRDTGEHLHNFITWKDLRSKELIRKWNKSYLYKTIQRGAYLLYLFGRNDRYLTASRLKLTTTQCTGRLLWVLENVAEVQTAAKRKNLCFGTIDTWLIYKLTGDTKYITEVSHASSTGLYDPFIMDWSEFSATLFNIPKHILPTVVNSDYDFGHTIPQLFGVPIPIKSLIADQQASMFGTCCFNKGDLKITVGTGSFINNNSGLEPQASFEGTYPLVAWTIGDKTTYLTEAACKDAGSLIQWALDVGIATEISEIANQAFNAKDSGGVFFIPAFSGLAPPIDDDEAASGFLGVKPTTTKDHLMRAILESIVYTVILAYKILKKNNNNTDLKRICVDGGVSNNDFVCQLLADMSDLKVIRYTSHEKTILGATFVAGLNTGIWKNTKELCKFSEVQKVFEPDNTKVKQHLVNMEKWLKAVNRFKEWYT